VFAGDVDDLALGALLVALRVKNESVDELAGMMDAVAPHVRALAMPQLRAAPVIVPTYNGARKLPNLVPLLALLLAREGVPVVLHGAAQEPQRVSTFEVLALLGHEPARALDEAAASLASHRIAAVPLALLCPALATLIDRRLALGVRNSGHTLAKLLLPHGVDPARACRLVAVTHPDFQVLMRQYFALAPGHVFLMRGVEGEAVVRLHAPQPIEQVDPEGKLVTHLLPECPAPELPAREAAATAQWTREVLDGRRDVPQALARQVALLVAHSRAAAEAPPALRIVQ
jgi:anthranilate phosphoribosyltransferase